ncbi:hypothetical protein P7K49_009997 [Saguinus oedipus]|uniref:Uncharacterized protein n=1 Tax=Saguinus oedipus TaxID=9490 RepID=A0ABQ9VLI6_SAGOE|nr:hypothetical protein P7K49_009997 [Saguinus oedipus]
MRQGHPLPWSPVEEERGAGVPAAADTAPYSESARELDKPDRSRISIPTNIVYIHGSPTQPHPAGHWVFFLKGRKNKANSRAVEVWMAKPLCPAKQNLGPLSKLWGCGQCDKEYQPRVVGATCSRGHVDSGPHL